MSGIGNETVMRLLAEQGKRLRAEARNAELADQAEVADLVIEKLKARIAELEAQVASLADVRRACIRVIEKRKARIAELEARLSTLLAHIDEMPNPHADPMRHYYNQMQVWKDAAAPSNPDVVGTVGGVPLVRDSTVPDGVVQVIWPDGRHVDVPLGDFIKSHAKNTPPTPGGGAYADSCDGSQVGHPPKDD